MARFRLASSIFGASFSSSGPVTPWRAIQPMSASEVAAVSSASAGHSFHRRLRP
jgi:hypothetical protein